MANPEHLEILKQGVKTWNEWRSDHPEVRPDLRKVELEGIDLGEADLHESFLDRAVLREVILRNANLSRATLNHADLTNADLMSANLTGADLSGAELFSTRLTDATLKNANLYEAQARWTDLSYANLSGAELIMTNLYSVTLRGTILDQTRFGYSIIALTSLEETEGLETCVHDAPSSIDYQTLIDSGPLPDVFLKGCGLPEDFIAHLRAAWCNPIEFYSCFISYSHADKSFARRLHDTLQGRGIRCWLDEHQVLPGDKIHRVVDEGIRLWDKVLLCASESALGPKGWWVNHELEKALKKEEQLSRERGQEVLAIIPLNLDGFMFRPDWQDWKKDILTTRAAPDFTDWKKDDDKFNAQIDKVIQALRADGGGRGHPPKPRL